MNAAEAKELLECKMENQRLRETIQKLTVAQDAVRETGRSMEIVERLIAFDIWSLRRGEQGIRWVGISEAEFKVCVDAARSIDGRANFVEAANRNEFTVNLPGGSTRVVPVKDLPVGCYAQLRDPMIVRTDSRIHNAMMTRRHGGSVFAPEMRIISFELKPLQAARLEVDAD